MGKEGAVNGWRLEVGGRESVKRCRLPSTRHDWLAERVEHASRQAKYPRFRESRDFTKMSVECRVCLLFTVFLNRSRSGGSFRVILREVTWLFREKTAYHRVDPASLWMLNTLTIVYILNQKRTLEISLMPRRMLNP